MKQLLLFFILIHSFTYSQNWTTSNTDQSDLINEISVVDDNVIWIKDQGNSVNGFSISTDGGITWVHKPFPSLFTNNNFSLGVLSAVSSTEAYIIVSYSENSSLVGLYKTTDAGDNWVKETSIFNNGTPFPNQVHFWDANHGFAMGDGLELYVYLDGSWYNQSSTISPIGTWSLNSSNYLKIMGDSAYFLSGAGTILKTTDQGISWSEIVTPFSSQFNLNFDFKDDSNGILVYNDFTDNSCYRTTDGGLTWSLLGSNITNLNSIIKYVPNEGKYYSISRDSNNYGLSYSSDDGLTWIDITEFDGELIGEIESSANGKVFMGGVSKVFYKDAIDYSSHPDYNTLVTFYSTLNGNLWTNNSNWLNPFKPLSSWYGISETNGRVTSINLPNNNLDGSLANALENLSELEILNLRSNSLYESVPKEIGNLTKLTFIDLANNYLSDEIPKEIENLQSLNWLDLSNNQLSGLVPIELTALPNLTRLALGLNELSGTLPDFTTQSLDVLSFDNNYFQFGDFENEFETYQNNVTQLIYYPQKSAGEFINSVLAIGNTQTLNTEINGSQNSYNWYRMNADGSEGGFLSSGNSINVTINNVDDYKWYYFYETTSPLVPDLIIRSNFFKFSDLPSNSPDYDALAAFYNSTNGNNWSYNTNWLDLSKPLSSWYGLVLEGNRVTQLNLGNNNLTGTLPADIGNLSELTTLNLWSNQLTGNIPSEIGNLINLETLLLNQNGLTGSIPNSFQNLTKLKHLYLTGASSIPSQINSYSGDFPDLTGLPLETLDIRYNHFRFTDIADELEIYKTNIQFFDFSPQYTIDPAVETNTNLGDDITLTFTDIETSSKGMNKKSSLAANTYQWYKDGVALTVNANSNTYLISNAQINDSGVYYCEITNTDTPEFVIKTQNITLNVGTLKIKENEKSNIKIFPNPAKNILNIKLNNIIADYANLFDITGKQILDIKLQSEMTVIDISNFKSGIYLLQIKTANNITTKRIIKE